MRNGWKILSKDNGQWVKYQGSWFKSLLGGSHVCAQLLSQVWLLGSHELGSQEPVRLLCSALPLEFPGMNIGVGCHILFQGIFPTQGSYPCFLSCLHCRQILLPLLHMGRHREQVKVEPIKIARQAVGFFTNSPELLWKIRTINVKCGIQETLQKLRERKRWEYEEVVNAPWMKKLRTE